jgi:acyl-homoserine-lactone acylase
MNVSWMRGSRSTTSGRPPRSSARAAERNARWRRWLGVCAAVCVLAACAPSSTGQSAPTSGRGQPKYQATIVWTGYGIPHITARNFGSLGYGYGFALASDDLCTMANGYITVEGQRSRYFGPSASVPMTPFTNLESDIFWQSVIDRHVIPRLLTIRTGPAAIGAQMRQLISGYVAGYNRYLASVGGSAGVPDRTCRGKAWVKPITTLDAYLLIYQDIDQEGQAGTIHGIAGAQPPVSTAAAAHPARGGAAAAELTALTQDTPNALSARAASVVRTPPGTSGLPSVRQLRELGERLSAADLSGGRGSNAIAVGSAGTRDHQHGMLLGNPHYPWEGIERFYEVQFTIPGMMNVEGATLYGIPLVVIGFTSSMAWSLTVSPAWTITPYQLTLVPGHPTEYVYDGKPTPMTSQTVTVEEASTRGSITSVKHTLWYTRYGPVINALMGMPLPWDTQTAFALDDANAGNLRMLNHFLATDEAQSAAQELSILKKYEGLPFVNTLAADSTGQALYADIMAIPDVSNAEAAECDTALGAQSFRQLGLPVLDGSRPACALGTDADSAVPGIFGPTEEPSLMTRDFVENSNDSYWLVNPGHPLTGYATIIGGSEPPGTDLGLRARSALAMVMGRINGTDGIGPPGFTFQDMKNLMFSDIQYGASLIKPQLVAMCRSFRGGRAPTSNGGTIPVGDSCSVLASWNGRENVGSRGAVLFREFWEAALNLQGGPWSNPFNAAKPLSTPSGLDTASSQVQQAFGDALVSLTVAHLPYDVALGTVQFVVRNGKKIPLPGGPGDPDGEFNAIYQNVLQQPGVNPTEGSSYIQDVTWTSGDSCPEAATLLTYSESDNPASPHYADQTELFSHSQWVTAYFCRAQVAAHAVSTTVLSNR